MYMMNIFLFLLFLILKSFYICLNKRKIKFKHHINFRELFCIKFHRIICVIQKICTLIHMTVVYFPSLPKSLLNTTFIK